MEPDKQCWLIHGDGLELIKSLKFDACITDPPYGLKWCGHPASTRKWQSLCGDDGSIDLGPMLRLEVPVVAFGANNYPEHLPHKGRWLCWDKRVNPKADRMLGSPFELAWTNRKSGFSRMYRLMHGGVVNADGRNIKRVHPTQKPVKLMEMIITDFTKPGDVVLDPFMGSGTTGVACMRMGRRFIGVEVDQKHFDTAVERLKQETSEMLCDA